MPEATCSVPQTKSLAGVAAYSSPFCVAFSPGESTPEIGLGHVTLTADGRGDPVLGGAGPRPPVLHWHGDTFDLPVGAVRLASSPAYANQAFRVGRTAYGLQFHVEVDAAWLDGVAAHLPPDVPLDHRHAAAVEVVGRAALHRFFATAG